MCPPHQNVFLYIKSENSKRIFDLPRQSSCWLSNYPVHHCLVKFSWLYCMTIFCLFALVFAHHLLFPSNVVFLYQSNVVCFIYLSCFYLSVLFIAFSYCLFVYFHLSVCLYICQLLCCCGPKNLTLYEKISNISVL